MKSIISKFFIGAALVAMTGLSACTGDLDQLPKDPNVLTPDQFQKDPKGYLGGILGKCYSSLAISGQYGPNGAADINGMDGGTSQYTRVMFYLEDLPTDIGLWIYQDAGVYDMVQDVWAANNVIIYGAYSRYYTHIAVCNDFIRLTRNLGTYGISVGGSGDTAISQDELDQMVREARALRGLSYYYVINWFGRAVIAWDDMNYGDTPAQAASAKELFDKVTADLEDVLATWPQNHTPQYGRIGRDAVEALLCKYYLNAESFIGEKMYDKCWSHAENIIARHQGGGFQGSGLAMDYLALFCGSNDMFMPGGSLPAQNEILWGVPYDHEMTTPWGGTMFLIAAPTGNFSDKPLTDGFCDGSWYGTNAHWGCLLAREQFSNIFGFVGGETADVRASLWLTEKAGYTMANTDPKSWANGYAAIKFTNVKANADGTVPHWKDPDTGLNRIGVQPVESSSDWPDTDFPIIRLADVYMMASECALRGAGDSGKGLQYANYVRQRAGVTPWNATDYTLDNIGNERAREFYHEGMRRTDLNRMNKFTGSAYNWTLKGGIQDGTALPSYMRLYPLPTNVIAGYGSSMVQNEGY